MSNYQGLFNEETGNFDKISLVDGAHKDWIITCADDYGTFQWSDLASFGVTSIQGTIDQVLANGTVGIQQTGDVILTLPQSISTTSSPTFLDVTLSSLSASQYVKTTTLKALTTVATIPVTDITGISGTAPIIYSLGAIGLNYNSTNLKITSSALNTIQDISTTSSPQFAKVRAGILGFAPGNSSIDTFSTGDITGGETYQHALMIGESINGGAPVICFGGDGNFGVTYQQGFQYGVGSYADIVMNYKGGNVIIGNSFTSNATLHVAGTTYLGSTVRIPILVPSRLMCCDGSMYVGSASTSANLTFTASTLDTVQNIQTTSSPTFANVTFNGISASQYVKTNASKALTTIATIPASDITGISATLPLTYTAGVIALNYNSSNLRILSSALDTIQDISTTSSPTFTALTLSDYLSAKNSIVCNSSSSTEGGQLVLTYGGITGATGEQASTWNLDVSSTSLFRIFRKDSLNSPLNLLTMSAVGVINLPTATASTIVCIDSSNNLNSVTVNSNLTYSSNTLDTVQNIQTTSSPTFANVTFNGISASQYVKTNASKALTTIATIPASDITGISATLPLTYTAGVIALNYSANLRLNTSSLDTIQDIQTTSTPQFSRIGLGTPAHPTAGVVVNKNYNSNTSFIPVIYSNCTFSLTANNSNNFYGVASTNILAVDTGHTLSGYLCSYYASHLFTGNVGTLSNVVGYYYDGGGSLIGSVTNAYGAYIVHPTAGANKYTAIFGTGGVALVGIGTATPTHTLEISGNVYSTDYVAGKNNIICNSTDANEGGQLILTYGGITGITTQSNSTWNIDVYTDTLRQFRIDSSGNILLTTSLTAAGEQSNTISKTNTTNGAFIYHINNNGTITNNVTSGTSANLFGHNNRVAFTNTTGAGVNCYGYYSTHALTGTTTIDNMYNMFLDQGTTSGTVTVGYGLFVKHPAFGTVKYTAILGDTSSAKVGIGGVPTYMLDVTDTSRIKNLKIGDMIGSSSYAGIGYNGLGSNDYALIQQSDGSTFVNASTGKVLSMRINNSSILDLNSSGGGLTGVFTINDAAESSGLIVQSGTASRGGEIQMKNLKSGLTVPNKYMRVNSVGDWELLNSVYSAVILACSDSLNVTVPNGTLTVASGIVPSNVTANTLIYANGSKVLSSVTVSSGLTFSSGTLSIDAATPPTYTSDLLTTGKFRSSNVSGFKEPLQMYSNAGVCYIEQTLNSITDSEIRINPKATTGLSTVSLFKDVNTTSNASLTIYKANNTSTINHKLIANNTQDSYLCADNGNVAIGSTSAAGNKLQVTGNCNITGNLTAGNFDSGSYTATFVNNSNVNAASSVGTNCLFSRNGHIVTISGRLQIVASANAVLFSFDITLPTAAVFLDYVSAWGTAQAYDLATSNNYTFFTIASNSGTARISFDNGSMKSFSSNILTGNSFIVQFTLQYYL